MCNEIVNYFSIYCLFNLKTLFLTYFKKKVIININLIHTDFITFSIIPVDRFFCPKSIRDVSMVELLLVLLGFFLYSFLFKIERIRKDMGF